MFPEHKFHIVDVLQKRGHIVGMTGAGVNDAPALKKADCGIAVSAATDAARAAASIVLTKPGLSLIIDAIKESRKIVQRLNSYAIYRIAETLRVLLFVTLAIRLAGFGILMTPLGWNWVLFVWGYAIVWFLLTDRVKLLAYRILDPVITSGAAPAGAPATEPRPPASPPGKTSATATAALATDL